jgi:hypothetical protein
LLDTHALLWWLAEPDRLLAAQSELGGLTLVSLDPSVPGSVRHLIEADLPDLLAQAAGRARHVVFRLQQQAINPCWSRPSLAAGVLV